MPQPLSSQPLLPEELLLDIDRELVEARLEDHIAGHTDRRPLLRERVLSRMERLGVARERAARDLEERLQGSESPVLEMETILFEIELILRSGEEDRVREALVNPR